MYGGPAKRTRSDLLSPRTFAIFGLSAFAIVGALATFLPSVQDHHFWSRATLMSALNVLTAAAVSIAAYFGIPPSSKEVARGKLEQVLNLYPIVQDAPSPRGSWFRQVRELVAKAGYPLDEIKSKLDSTAEGDRMMALVELQRQWPLEASVRRIMDAADQTSGRPGLPTIREAAQCYHRVLELVVVPGRALEQYHAIRVLWGMFDHLDSAQQKEVFDSIRAYKVDKNTCEKWGAFAGMLNTRGLSTQS